MLDGALPVPCVVERIWFGTSSLRWKSKSPRLESQFAEVSSLCLMNHDQNQPLLNRSVEKDIWPIHP